MKDFSISLTTSPVPHKRHKITIANVVRPVLDSLLLIAAGIVFWYGVVQI